MYECEKYQVEGLPRHLLTLYTCIHIRYACVYAYMYVCMFVCMYVYMYICMYDVLECKDYKVKG